MTPFLWDYWRSSAAYRARIALNLKGIDYASEQVDLVAGDHRGDANMARNPQGLVPTLEIDGLTLTQSLPIIEYLDETRPDVRLIPADPAARHRVRAISAAIAMEIHPVCNLSVAKYASGLAGTEMKDWMLAFIPKGLMAVERMLGDGGAGAFCHGAAPTLADCCLMPQLYNARRWGVDLEPLPMIRAIEARCGEMEAFRAAHPDAIGAPS
ncbi:MAG: maleylacetoacetate isomerase [Pseudomonadota bacterium]